jgi:hypothetical protein
MGDVVVMDLLEDAEAAVVPVTPSCPTLGDLQVQYPQIAVKIWCKEM